MTKAEREDTRKRNQAEADRLSGLLVREVMDGMVQKVNHVAGDEYVTYYRDGVEYRIIVTSAVKP